MPNYAGAIPRDNWEKHGERPSVLDFSGSDLGERINHAVAATASAEILVNTSGGSVISTPVIVPPSHTLRFAPGVYELHASITLQSGASIIGSGMSVGPDNGTILRAKVAGLHAVVIDPGAIGGIIDNIGFDGGYADLVRLELGGAIRFDPGDLSLVTNRWYVSNVGVVAWRGAVIDMPGHAEDCRFTNITVSDAGSVSQSKGCIEIGLYPAANMFSGVQMDTCAFAGIHNGAGGYGGYGGENRFANLKIDTNVAPSGTIGILYDRSAGVNALGDRYSNLTIRADSHGVGPAIKFCDDQVWDVAITNAFIYRAETPGSSIGIDNTAGGQDIRCSNVSMQYWGKAIKDHAVGSCVNAYRSMTFRLNTADYEFSPGFQPITGRASDGTPISKDYQPGITNFIEGARPSDGKLILRPKPASSDPVEIQKADGTMVAQFGAGGTHINGWFYADDQLFIAQQIKGNRGGDSDLVLATKTAGAGGVVVNDGGGTQKFKLNAATGRAEVSTAGAGVTVVSPDGLTSKLIHIDNSGQLVTAPTAPGSPDDPPAYLPNVGTAGTYTKVTTDAQGRVSSGTTLADSDIPTTSRPISTQSGDLGPAGANARALNTVYQNTTGKVKWVSVNCGIPNGVVSLNGLTDASNPPTTAVVQQANYGTTTNAVHILFPVLPGNYYKVSAPGGSGSPVWFEWS